MSLRFTVSRLCNTFSLEITPREARRIRCFTDHVAPGTSVYLTYLAGKPFSDTIEVARRLAGEYMRPIPHLAVRALRDERDLDEKLAELTGERAVDEVLLTGGSLRHPVGEFDATIQVLRTGCLERRGIRRVGVARDPEGNPDVSDEGLPQALKEKNGFAAETPMKLYLVSQFCFAPEPIVAWERQIRADGNQLPIRVGLPGLATPPKLLKFGVLCGVGPSLTALRRQLGNVVRMATTSTYHPDETLVGVARAALSDRESLIRGFHFFPFGSFGRTAAWASSIGDGRFALDLERDRLQVER